MNTSSMQHELFAGSLLPDGFRYDADFLTHADAQLLLTQIQRLPLAAARYRAFTAKRRIVSFGVGYDFTSNQATAAPPLPPSLHPLRDRAARWAGVLTGDLVQCTIAEYTPGTQLGWHRDVPNFGVVVGISLAGSCRMRLRPYPHIKHARQPARTIVIDPRSIYLFSGDARWRWQHAISPTRALRYSITFRTMRS
jgi:alkylated DNA repair dioxygenase AlkB